MTKEIVPGASVITESEQEEIIAQAYEESVSQDHKVYQAYEKPEAWKAPLPEAGGVAWTELYGKKEGQVIKINLTSRGKDAYSALSDLLECLTMAKEQYKLSPVRPDITQAPQTMQAPIAPAPTAQAPVMQVPAELDDEPHYEPIQEGGIIRSNSFIVTPRADGKTKVDFMAAGRKYPEISCVMTPAQLAGMFGGGWTEDHFKAIATYNVESEIAWRPSKTLNKAGNPYKNIVTFKLL